MRRLLLIALLAAIVPVGCGGSDDEGSSSSTGTTAEDTAQSTTDRKQSGGDGNQPKSDDDQSKSGSSKSDGSSKKDDSSQSTGGSSPPATDTTQSEPSSSGPPLAKKAFIRRADRACRQFGRRIRNIPDDAVDPNEAAGNYRRVATEADTLYRRFAALPKPRGDEQRLTRYQALLKDRVAVTKQTADAIEKNDEARGRSLIQSSQTLSSKSRKLAKSYGFRICS